MVENNEKKTAGFLSILQIDRFVRRLILSMILVVILTVALGGLPAIVAIWIQLERQVQLSVQNAQVATKALYEVERTHLMDVATLVSERPTLCSLVYERDMSGLEAYLDTLRQSTKTDSIFVITPDGQIIGSDQIGISEPATLLADRGLPFSDFIASTDPPGLFVVSAADVRPPEDCVSKGGGKVIIVHVLDNEFMLALAMNTGLEQNLIVNEIRVATSLDQIPGWPIGPDEITHEMQSGEGCCTRGVDGGEEYYLGHKVLLNDHGEVVAISEVALPGRAIRIGMWRTIGFLFGVGFIAVLGGTILAIYVARRITQPLTQLAESAERMGAGDLDTPVSVRSDLVELRKLADQLDHARRQLQETFLETQQEVKHIERLFGAIPQGVIALDDEGHVTFFNPDAEKILGIDADNAMNAHFTQIFAPAPGEILTIHEVLHPVNGAPPARHITILNAEGRQVTLAITASELVSHSRYDHQRERVLVLRDIGEERMVNLLRANFLATVAHEVRTPLSGITASLELLHEEGPTLNPEELAELTNTIHLSTLRLHTLLDNLLETATLDAGSFRVHQRPIRFQNVLNTAVSMMMPLFVRRNQRLDVKSPADLPTIWADPDRLTQVLVNLLSNASKFSPMSSPIRLTAERDGDNLTVSVLDAGPGLPDGLFADLFKRFAIGEQPQGDQYGIGLGLSVVKAIVEAHDGHIGAENHAEGGTRVWFTLPFTPLKQEKN